MSSKKCVNEIRSFEDLQEFNYYHDNLTKHTERKLNHYIIFREAAYDVSMRPRFFFLRWIIGTYKISTRIIKRTLGIGK